MRRAFGPRPEQTLQACLARHRNGYPPIRPFYTVSAQPLISCGMERIHAASGRPYTQGCSGGTLSGTYHYLQDHGVTTEGCWPYQQGSVFGDCARARGDHSPPSRRGVQALGERHLGVAVVRRPVLRAAPRSDLALESRPAAL